MECGRGGHGRHPPAPVSDGESRGGGAQRASMLADAVEALLGAVYSEAGFDAALAVVRRLVGEVIQATEVANWSKDAKTELQEQLQSRHIAVPAYRIVAARGEKHAQTFEVECAVAALGLAARGEGRSRRMAEQDAAAQMLTLMKSSDHPLGSQRN